MPAGAGNTQLSDEIKTELTGLSPLARGTLLNNVVNSVSWRFIPAGAGNTISPSALTSPSTVYPRWRGEHVAFVAGIDQRHGLSPLARGTHRIETPATEIIRFIPAGAGNTSNRNPSHRNNSVYPRWRGEHAHVKRHQRSGIGLSPLARGTQSPASEIFHPPRFIPAGAGNTGTKQPDR